MTKHNIIVANVKRASERARRFPTYAAMVAALSNPLDAAASVRAEVARLRVLAMLGIEV